MKNPIHFILLLILDLLLLASAILLIMKISEIGQAKESEVSGKVVLLETDYAAYPLDEKYFQVVSTPDPAAPDFVFEFEEKITEHELDPADVELLARLLYRSPLRHEDYKRELLWVVFNRIDDERAGLFGRTIQEVVIPSEFAYLPGDYELTEENVQIVREELNRWLSYLDGNYVEIPIPRDAVYARFKGTMNRQLEVFSELKEG